MQNRAMKQLSDQLNLYNPSDEAEAAHRLAILNLLETQLNPFDRNCYEPGHITGSAWIMATDTQQVGLIYHRKLDRWLQPGGHVEVGEIDGLSTALREAREEIGLELDPACATLFDLDVHRIPERGNQPSHLHFDIRYLCLTTYQPLVSASDAANARWFSLAELEPLDIDFSMRRMVSKIGRLPR
jgi:8-oxo-dGTP pyrophosphatase MutT (NUDIX family)